MADLPELSIEGRDNKLPVFSINDSTSLESGCMVFVLHDKNPRTLSTYICEAYQAQT